MQPRTKVTLVPVMSDAKKVNESVNNLSKIINSKITKTPNSETPFEKLIAKLDAIRGSYDKAMVIANKTAEAQAKACKTVEEKNNKELLPAFIAARKEYLALVQNVKGFYGLKLNIVPKMTPELETQITKISAELLTQTNELIKKVSDFRTESDAYFTKLKAVDQSIHALGQELLGAALDKGSSKDSSAPVHPVDSIQPTASTKPAMSSMHGANNYASKMKAEDANKSKATATVANNKPQSGNAG